MIRILIPKSSVQVYAALLVWLLWAVQVWWTAVEGMR